MPLLSQPLYGSQASGSIDKMLTYTNQWGWAVLRSFRTTPTTKTAAQQARRDLFSAAVAAWRLVPPPTKLLWAASATPPWTGYNLFIYATLTGKTLADFPPTHSYYGVTPLGQLEYGWDD